MKELINTFNNVDCMEFMKSLPNNSVNFSLTDIPYDGVTRKTGGLRQLKTLDIMGAADKKTFDEVNFIKELYRITKNSGCVFCGYQQIAAIWEYLETQKCTIRIVTYVKSNPSPANGQYVYLNGTEVGVWFKKRGAKVFNAHCKIPVFKCSVPSGKNRIHKTQKPDKLWEELIKDNTNEEDIVFDPCAGSGITARIAKKLNRNFICCELDKEIFDISSTYLKESGIL